MAQKALNQAVLALEIPEAGPEHRGLLYLSSNFTRNLTVGRVISALRFFADHHGPGPESWLLLGIDPGTRLHSLWTAWLSLPRSWDQPLSRGNICLECAELLLALEEKNDLEPLFPFFQDLGWSKNNSLNFITWISEQASNNGQSLRTTIDRLSLDQILQSNQSPADKTKKILKKVFEARYPVFSRLKNRTRQSLRQLEQRSLWQVRHRDDFESTDLIFSARIRNQQDLHRALGELQEISSSSILDQWPVSIHE
nr:hypothetical protein [Desulfonatronovibrio hydrogenovorans]